MAMRVRRAGKEDAFKVAALHIQDERERGVVPPVGFLDAFADAWLADDRRVTWLAEHTDGRPVGVVHGVVVRPLPSPRRTGPTAVILGETLFVSPEARGDGVGERLLDALLDWAGEHGIALVRIPADDISDLAARGGLVPSLDGIIEIRLGADTAVPGFVT